jgi:hypothetical protein
MGDLCKIPRGVLFDLYRGTVRYLDESLTLDYLDGTNEDTSDVGLWVRLAICI